MLQSRAIPIHVEHFHSISRDTTDKEQGGHVGVHTKLWKVVGILLLRGHQHGGHDVP